MDWADTSYSRDLFEPQLTGVLHQERHLAPPDETVIMQALQKDAVARRILAKGEQPIPGMCVGVRLNINVLKSTGVAVHSIHRPTSKDGHRHGRGFYRGEVISYLPVVVLRDAYFSVHQKGREAIASGTMAKHPMASIDGTFVRQPEYPSYDGIAIRFNPRDVHLFVDDEYYAVQYAEEVTILGHRAYARGRVTYFTTQTAPQREGASPSAVRFKL